MLKARAEESSWELLSTEGKTEYHAGEKGWTSQIVWQRWDKI